MIGKTIEHQIYSIIIHVPDVMSEYDKTFATLLKYNHFVPTYEWTADERAIVERLLAEYLKETK